MLTPQNDIQWYWIQ